ncbi:hypothetical protein CALVIDRAFT_512853 [Calocera viscosa TUFC12733]|uniref:Glycopeptide n=1 Tax=Calocera viscosa (strain TUFC12733) TaxID=1330018 RepID=A0A167NGW2_CALVF|nr:hypothetical protein CALVIDRAFT_512853 [Calocera viscosa TUFC12733]
MLAFLSLLALPLLARVARAESHTISFINSCGSGTPTLILNGQVASSGAPYTSSGSLSGIAYLQTGACNFNGENCSLLEFTLTDNGGQGGVSSVDVSLIPPHAFSVPTGFYYDGVAECQGDGNACDDANCGPDHAFFQSTDYTAQVQCSTDQDVNLVITFCADGAASTSTSSTSSATTTSSASSATDTADAASATTTSTSTTDGASLGQALAAGTDSSSSSSSSTSTSSSSSSSSTSTSSTDPAVTPTTTSSSTSSSTSTSDSSAASATSDPSDPDTDDCEPEPSAPASKRAPPPVLPKRQKEGGFTRRGWHARDGGVRKAKSRSDFFKN